MVSACDAAGVAADGHENFAGRARSGRRRDPRERGDRRAFWGRVSFRSAFDVSSGQPFLATGERFIIEDPGIQILDVARFLFGDVAELTAHFRHPWWRLRSWGSGHHCLEVPVPYRDSW